jgi:nitrite reductase/ring-hydroxylating ferredoxin subunit
MMEQPEEFTRVAEIADIPDGTMKCVAIDRERVLLACVDGRFYAIGDMCGHRNAPLSRGKLAGHIVECPLHFAQFDVRSGKLIDGPISTDVRSYEVKVDGGHVLVRR